MRLIIYKVIFLVIISFVVFVQADSIQAERLLCDIGSYRGAGRGGGDAGTCTGYNAVGDDNYCQSGNGFNSGSPCGNCFSCSNYTYVSGGTNCVASTVRCSTSDNQSYCWQAWTGYTGNSGDPHPIQNAGDCCGGATKCPDGVCRLSCITPTPSLSPSPSPSPSSAPSTSEYRCSDIRFNKDDTSSPAPVWKKYENEDYSGEPIKFKYIFTNNVVQDKNLILFCQFKTDQGTTSQVYPKSIKYIGEGPKIKSAVCSYDPSGTGTQVIVKGLNFGSHDEQGNGNLKLADKESVVSFWGEDTASSASASISSSSAEIKNKIVGKITDKLDEGRYPVVLTTDNDRSAKGYCGIGLTTIDFSIKTQCGIAVNMPDVALEIKENTDKAKILDKRKVKLDAEGKPGDYAPKLEIGKEYSLFVHSSNSLSRKVNFKAEEGSTSLGDIILLSGDIYGQGGLPDNVINAFDKAELTREWNILNDITRPGDLNGDGRVNSIDYACLRQNIGKIGDI